MEVSRCDLAVSLRRT